jgi:hypothetical protein
MDSLTYLLSVLVGLAAYVMAGALLWAGVEAVYFIWCKVRGIKY